jgi:Kef-type K+ transport system membrane component KefB
MGVSMSVTAFPVLARILTDLRVNKTHLGTLALTCAAVDDATAWCLLALSVSVAHGAATDAVVSVILTVAFVAIALIAGAPLVRRWLVRVESAPGLSKTTLAIILVAMLLSALATEYIGIHAIFGAFLLGAIVPQDSDVARGLGRQMHSLVTILLLPAFFAFTGMRTRIDLLSGLHDWLICGLIIVVATAGKFAGAFVAARSCGMRAREAAMLGALMNTRGLMELIVLNVGFDLGVITPRLFAMMVLMALATTMSTAPLLKVFGARE